MKKLAIALLTLYTGAVILILAGIYAVDLVGLPDIGHGARNDTGIALQVALNDPAVKDIISQKGTRYTADVKPVNSSSHKGYLNYSGTLMSVWVEAWQEPAPAPYRFGFIVDTSREVVLDFMPMLDVLPGPEEITIPHGSAWYYCIANTRQQTWGGLPSTRFEASFTPHDAHVYQAIVNKEGLEEMRNAASSMPLTDPDLCRSMVVYNCTMPEAGGWNTSVTWPAVELPEEPGTSRSLKGYAPASDFYLVFVNGDASRDVQLTFRTPFGTF